jgi:putative membrane protein
MGDATNPRGTRYALWTLLLLFAAANVLPLFPRIFPRIVLPASQIIPAMLFALIHGARVYRPRGILTFTLISMAVGFGTETVGVLTGFPFGHYYFTGAMGPKLFVVPLLMGPAYVGMGYVSWTVAWVILGPRSNDAAGQVVTLPLAASFVMVAWDLSFDPALSTIGHYWIWVTGGAYFGVPVSNFLGWFLTNYLIYQFFMLYTQRRPATASLRQPAHARLALIFYAVCAGGGVLRALSPSPQSLVTDPTGTLWRIGDINGACAVAAFFVMGAFSLLALVRLSTQTPALQFGLKERPHDRNEMEKIAVSRQTEMEQVP